MKSVGNRFALLYRGEASKEFCLVNVTKKHFVLLLWMLFGSEASEQQRLSRGAIVHFFALQGPQSRNNQELLCCCYLALGHFWPLNLLSTLNISSHLNARPPTTFDKSSKWDRLILFSWNFSWAYTNKARIRAERFQLLTRISKWVKCSRLQLWTPNFFLMFWLFDRERDSHGPISLKIVVVLVGTFVVN